MSSGKKQVTGYKYYANIMSFLGNSIEGLIGINFDKRGWIQSKEVENGLMKAGLHTFDSPTIYGETEGGIGGKVAIYDGLQQNADEHYQQNYALAPAYKGRSYLMFRDFYVGNNPFLKDMLFWVKRIHVKGDGSPQWYDEKAEIFTIKEAESEIYKTEPTADINTDIVKKYKWVGSYNHENIDNLALHVPQPQPNIMTALGETSTGYSGVDPEQKSSSSTKIFINYAGITRISGIVEYTQAGDFKVTGDNIEIISINREYAQPTENADIAFFIEVLVLSKNSGIVEILVENNNSISRNGSWFCWASSNLSVDFPRNIETHTDGVDINPIHKIRELLTDKSAMNKPESDINEANFQSSADRIHDEGLGISWAIAEKSCVDALNELCTHIEAGVRVNRQTGQYEVVLFRDDLNSTENSLHFNESNIKSLQFDVVNSDEIINTLNVNYYDRENIKESTFNVYENGLIRTVGYEKSENINFPYFMNRRNAEIVANWKLKQFSTQAFKGSFTTGLYNARKLNRFDIILLSWSNRNIINLPCRVTGINLGDGINNTVTIDFAEIVPYSNMMQSNINSDESNNQILPPQENESIVFEMPYYEAVQNYGEVEVNAQLDNTPELGYLMVATKRPQNNSLHAQLQTTAGAGWERTGTVNYAPSCMILEEMDYLTTEIRVENMHGLSELSSDIVGQINDELIAFVSFNSYTNTLTVKRGILDTIPAKHNIGDSIYFWDESSGIDSTQYLMSENVNAKVLTTTPSGVQDFDNAPLLTLEMNARAIRPYPPANIKINDYYYPQSVVITNDLTITWADRNRLQQTGGSIISWTDSSVTKESNVLYNIELEREGSLIYSAYDIDDTQHTILSTVLIQNKSHKLKLWSSRDDFDNYQTFEHAFFIESASLLLTATVSKDKVVGNTVQYADINVNVDESLSANMVASGLEIKGKAEAGATITIEIED